MTREVEKGNYRIVYCFCTGFGSKSITRACQYLVLDDQWVNEKKMNCSKAFLFS